jgi:hypothetical protein
MKWYDSSIFIVAALSIISAAKAENNLVVQSGAWSCTATNVHGVAYTNCTSPTLGERNVGKAITFEPPFAGAPTVMITFATVPPAGTVAIPLQVSAEGFTLDVRTAVGGDPIFWTVRKFDPPFRTYGGSWVAFGPLKAPNN